MSMYRWFQTTRRFLASNMHRPWIILLIAPSSLVYCSPSLRRTRHADTDPTTNMPNSEPSTAASAIDSEVSDTA